MAQPEKHFENIFAKEHLKEGLTIGDQKFQAIADVMVDAIISITGDSKVTFWNKAAESLFGYTSEEILGKDLTIIMPERYRLAHKRGIKRFTETRKGNYVGEVIELEGLRKDGSEFPLQLTVAAWGAANEVIFIGIVRDVTEASEEKELSKALAVINSKLTSTTDIVETIDSVTVEAAKALGSKSDVLYVRDELGWQAKCVYGLPKSFKNSVLTGSEAKHLLGAARSKTPVIIANASMSERIDAAFADKFGIGSLIVIPLKIRDEIEAIITFHFQSTDKKFSDAQLDFVERVASSVSLALETSKTYLAQKNIADTLQSAMLALPGEIDGIEHGSLYRSATEIAAVGGDLYDLFELEHGKVGIVIGDVSGKGLAASTLTTVAKNTIRAYAHHEDSPAKVLEKTNDIILKASGVEDFVTIFFGILDIRTGMLRYSSGGHPPPILKREGGDTFFLKTNSPLVGVFKNSRFFDEKELLNKQDLLLCYTDGLIETRCRGELYGDERLLRLTKSTEYKTPKNIPEKILSDVLSFCQQKLSDDVVLLAIKRT